MPFKGCILWAFCLFCFLSFCCFSAHAQRPQTFREALLEYDQIVEGTIVSVEKEIKLEVIITTAILEVSKEFNKGTGNARITFQTMAYNPDSPVIIKDIGPSKPGLEVGYQGIFGIKEIREANGDVYNCSWEYFIYPNQIFHDKSKYRHLKLEYFLLFSAWEVNSESYNEFLSQIEQQNIVINVVKYVDIQMFKVETPKAILDTIAQSIRDQEKAEVERLKRMLEEKKRKP